MNKQKVDLLIQARVRQGWAQTDLAERMGVATKTVARWESGQTIPQPVYRARLGTLLQIDPGVIWPFPSGALDPANQPYARVDWGEAPHLKRLCGRDREIAIVQQWIMDNCRLVALLGMGGIGKTSFAATMVNQVQEHYDYIFWRSLSNAPPLTSLLQEFFSFITDQQQAGLPEEADRYISLVVESFRVRRCLVVLDNVESIFQQGSQAGRYRDGYEAYGRLFQRIGESQHLSCLLLTSREKPPEVALLEEEALTSTRSLHLQGLSFEAGQQMLGEGALQGTEQDWKELVSHYGGNPLALKLVAQVIREVFGNTIAAFLTHGEVFFQDVRALLEQHMKRLSPLEEEILYWLTIEREAIPFSELQENIVSPMSKGALQDMVLSLRQRQLMETRETGFLLQPVIMEYLTDRLISQVCEEIMAGQLLLFDRHALLKAQAREYIRQSQCRLIVQPLLQRLSILIGNESLEQRLQHLLAIIHGQADQYPGYAAGNILNLLIQSGCMLDGYDFSHLVVRQAYLIGIDLLRVNFTSAHLATSVFTDTFGSVPCVTFSRQGDILAAGTVTGEIRLWHAKNGLPLSTLFGHTDWIWAIAVSPDGKLLASGSADQLINLWEIASGQLWMTLQGHVGGVKAVAFHPDGKQLASGGEDGTVRLWDVSSSKIVSTLQGHTEAVNAVTFHPDGTLLASGSADQTIHLWNVSSGQRQATLRGQTGGIRSIAFSPGGALLASGSSYRTVSLWEIGKSRSPRILDQGSNKINKVLTVTFSPDGTRLASGSTDQTIRVWDVEKGQLCTTLQGHTSVVRSVTFSPDGKTLASGSADRSIRLWEVESGKNVHTWQGYTNRVLSVAFGPDGKTLASGNDDRMVRLWDVSEGTVCNTLHGHQHWVRSVAFSLEGTMLASGSEDRTVRVWEVPSGKILHILHGHTAAVNAVAFAPDGAMLASSSVDGKVRLWEVSSGKVLHVLQGHTGIVNAVAFHGDGKILASGSEDQVVRLWEVSSGKELYTFQKHAGTVSSVAFSSNGVLLASGSFDQTVRIWEIKSRKVLLTLHGHTGNVSSVAFSPDGTLLASGGFDQTVRIWEVSSGKMLQTLRGDSGTIWSVSFNQEGTLLASGSFDRAICLWDMSSGKLLRTLKGDRPYEQMNITRASGLTKTQRGTLRLLGAIEQESPSLACRHG